MTAQDPAVHCYFNMIGWGGLQFKNGSHERQNIVIHLHKPTLSTAEGADLWVCSTNLNLKVRDHKLC